MTVVLAADTATDINTVAICRDTAILAESYVDCRRRHSERLLPTIHWLLAEAGLDMGKVDLLAVSHGPGSFTGLRIGLATFKGLAFGQELPLIGVSTLDAMARFAQSCLGPQFSGAVLPLLDARMQEVYGARYVLDHGECVKRTPGRVCPVEALIAEGEGPDCPPLVFGEGAEAYRERILATCTHAVFADDLMAAPRASAVAAEALAKLAAGDPADAARVEPVYLRASQAENNRAARAREEAG